MKSTYSLLFILSISCSCYGQQSDNSLQSPLDSSVHQLVANYMKDGNRVGLSIGVTFNGRSYLYNYGETSPGSGILPTDKSLYEIGSITKTFTGLLISHAITEGRMTLNDDIRKFLPGSFPNLQYLNGDPIKIAYLLAHTAQLPNSFADPLSTSMSNDAFFRYLHEIKLDSLRSFNYQYSNVGYQLLGLILENVYQQSYATLIDKYITRPLGMLQTKLTYGGSDDKLLLTGFDAKKDPVKMIPVTLPAAGGLRSSARDLLKYLQFQNLEKTPAVRLTHQIIVGDIDREAYGFQWAIGKTWNWDQYIRIDGGTQGFRSFCVMYPLHQVNIVILSNQKDDSAGIGLYKIATGIYGTVKKIIVTTR